MESTLPTRQANWTQRLERAPLSRRVFVPLAVIILVGLSAFAQAADASAGEIEVRVAAQRLDDGRTEFAIQERREGEAWGERRLPRSRFFPASASVGRWLSSSSLAVALPGIGEVEVRVATQLLSDGRMEFAIQERLSGGEWGERRLPRSRFLPAGAGVGRWLSSSPLAVPACRMRPATWCGSRCALQRSCSPTVAWSSRSRSAESAGSGLSVGCRSCVSSRPAPRSAAGCRALRLR